MDIFGILQVVVIGLGVVLAIAGVVLIVFDGDINKVKKMLGKITGKKIEIEESTKKAPKSATQKKNEKNVTTVGTTQEFLDFEEIVTLSKDDPKGLIVKKDGKGFVAVVEVKGLNYNLLSLEEREILEMSFGKLLNGIDYPVQIYIQSRKLYIENYNTLYTKRLEEIKKNYENLVNRQEFLAKQGQVEPELNHKIERVAKQYNYGLGIKDWTVHRSKEKNMIERKYYIIISYYHNSSNFKEQLTSPELIANAFFDLQNKASSIISALRGANLDGSMLTNVQLAELLYIAYNRGDSEIYKLQNALKARFSHFFTTAEPVEMKTIKRKINELDNA